jgi:3-dehydroquinate synthase
MKKPTDKLLITEDLSSDLRQFLLNRQETNFFIITDDIVHEYCWPLIADVFDGRQTSLIKIPQGEKNKTIETAAEIWTFLLNRSADRKSSLIINLGGGLVTDTGAFAASVFKRGIPYANIPTSLLAQADAAIGGKNGVNFQSLKNQIGCFGVAEETFIYPEFTKSLHKREFLSGLAEMFKHALLSDKSHWEQLMAFAQNLESEGNLIPVDLLKRTTDIKLSYTQQDRNEKGIRAALNLGHTFGHAIESVYSASEHPIKHGEAVAAGMIMELFLSHKKLNFSLKTMLKTAQDLIEFFEPADLLIEKTDALVKAMLSDKKNIGNSINCILLSDWGKPILEHTITREDVSEALNFYVQLVK